MIFTTIFIIKSLLTLLLGVICVTGDILVEVNKENHLLKAVCDNLTHGFIGFVSYLVVTMQFKHVVSLIEQIMMIFGCFVISCGIDVDHFIVARSWRLVVRIIFQIYFFLLKNLIFFLQHATNLPNRPFLHCSTIPLLLLVAVYFVSVSYKSANSLKVLLWMMMLFTAFISHHVRDATRRGLWFFGYGHTLPVPYYGYVLLVMAIPWIMVRIVEQMTVIKGPMAYTRVVDV